MPSCLEQGQFSIFEKVELQIVHRLNKVEEPCLWPDNASFEKEIKEAVHILMCSFG